MLYTSSTKKCMFYTLKCLLVILGLTLVFRVSLLQDLLLPYPLSAITLTTPRWWWHLTINLDTYRVLKLSLGSRLNQSKSKGLSLGCWNEHLNTSVSFNWSSSVLKFLRSLLAQGRLQNQIDVLKLLLLRMSLIPWDGGIFPIARGHSSLLLLFFLLFGV